jgi:hypothetical protein
MCQGTVVADQKLTNCRKNIGGMKKGYNDRRCSYVLQMEIEKR